MCVACALCVSVFLHSRTSALPHLAGTALPTPVRSHTGSHWSTAPCVQLLQCTASLPGGSGQWNSCNALPHCPGGSGQWNSCHTLPHCLGAVGSGTPATHCLTAWGQWAVDPLQYTAALPGGQWAVQLLQCTASLPGGSGQCNSCNALPHCLVWCGVVWCGVVWCGVVWCGVVWCGVVWCGVVWCSVVWFAEGDVTKRLWPGWYCIRVMLRQGCVCRCALCVLCFAPVQRPAPFVRPAGSIHGRPGDSLPLRLLVQLHFP